MASSESTSIGPFRAFVLGLATVAVVVLIALAPGLFGLDATGWWVTVTIGVAMGAAVVIYGYIKRDAGDSDAASPQRYSD